jgi:hypothetical protein
MQISDIITSVGIRDLMGSGILTYQDKTVNGVPLRVHKLSHPNHPFARLHNLVIERSWNSVIGYAPQMVGTIVRASETPIHSVAEYIDAPEGVVWRHGIDWGVVVEGSFDSPEALWAYDWLKARRFVPNVEGFNFRVVAPQFRRTVPYAYSGVVITGMVVTNTEYQRSDVRHQAHLHGLRSARPIRGLFRKNIDKAAAKYTGIAGFLIYSSRSLSPRYFLPTDWYKQLQAEAVERAVLALEQRNASRVALEVTVNEFTENTW